MTQIIFDPHIFTDVYAASGVTVGTQIEVQNVGQDDVWLKTSAANPGTDRSDMFLLPRGQWLRNLPNTPGEWVFSRQIGSIIVRVI